MDDCCADFLPERHNMEAHGLDQCLGHDHDQVADLTHQRDAAIARRQMNKIGAAMLNLSGPADAQSC